MRSTSTSENYPGMIPWVIRTMAYARGRDRPAYFVTKITSMPIEKYQTFIFV
jgi:hypothetical protein